jgi:hypothetical protein
MQAAGAAADGLRHYLALRLLPHFSYAAQFIIQSITILSIYGLLRILAYH